MNSDNFFCQFLGFVLSQSNGDVIRQKRQSEDGDAIYFPDSDDSDDESDADSEIDTDNRYFSNHRRRPYKRPNRLQYQPQRQRPQQNQFQQRPQAPNQFQQRPQAPNQFQQRPQGQNQFQQRPQAPNQYQQPGGFQQLQQPSQNQYQFQQRPFPNQFQNQQQRPTQRPTQLPVPAPTTLAPAVRTCNMRCGETTTNEFDPVCGSDLQTYNNRGYLECARRCGVATEFIRQGRCRPRITPVN